MSTSSDWHALSPAEALRQSASGAGGLSREEAARRLRRVGPNAFDRTAPASAWSVLLAQLRSLMVLLLVVAAVIAVVSHDLLDAAAIVGVLLLNVAIGFFTELRAHRAMEALLGLEVSRAVVLRSGRSVHLDAQDLVPGDVIVVEAGATVPADARLLDAVELQVVEASLTGESAPVEKRASPAPPAETPLPERLTMIYKATTVVAGRGTAVVVATGMRTEVGRIGTLTAAVARDPTPLERRLELLGRQLALLALAIGLAVALLGLAQGRPIGGLIQTAIALAVAAVPEGLPVVGTIAMAVGVRRMARRHALVRHLPAVETLGSATVICTDKTGTLTAGRMTVTVVRLADREVEIPPGDFAPPPDLALALRIGALANRGHHLRTGDQLELVGDPTETALLVAAARAGLDPATLRAEWPEVGEVPFSSERMYMATFHRTSAAGLLACVKGAPGRVLDLCGRMRTPGGTREIRPEERERILAFNHELATRGLRVLALAMKEVSSPTAAELRDLVWIGHVGLMDPPAAGVRDTIAALQTAGIRILMLTGDQRPTGERVALDLGLLRPGDRVLDGAEVDRLSEDELRAAVERAAVFTRVSPEAKLRIVAALQRRGEIVAMLGDGVNDAAALRQADIGVAMGGRGTDLAKEAADLVLEDDRFTTIGVAVEHGRAIFDNLRKSVFYLFSCNLAEILVVLGAAVAGYPSPLLPLQILWLNLLTDTFPALALAVEPGEADVMRQPPRDPKAQILFPAMLWRVGIYGALIAGCTIAAYAWGLRGDGSTARASTLAFLTLAYGQIFHLGNARSDEPVVRWRKVVANRWALAAVAVAGGFQLLAIAAPPLARVLGVHRPEAMDLLVALVLALVPAVIGQGAKALGRM
ncbi:MAG TPA: cation-transporting P-type ATPase [Gemmatimonadales bacterium]